MITDVFLKPLGCDDRAAAILYGGSIGACGPGNLPPEIVDALRGCNADAVAAVRTNFQSGDHHYSCRAYFIEPRNGGFQPLIAVLFEKQLGVRDCIHHIASQYRLTGREQEVLRGVSEGLTNKELANQMQISPNTVKSYLRVIMVKMRVTTRGGLVGKLLSTDQ